MARPQILYWQHFRMKFALTWFLFMAVTAWSVNATEPVPFRVGEKLTYNIQWGPIVAGHATLTVAGLEQIDGQDCYHIIGQAQTSGFVDLLYHVESKIETWLDTDGFFTRRFYQARREGKRCNTEDSRYDYVSGQVVTTNLISGQLQTSALTGPEQDVLSVFYFLRTQPLLLNHTSRLPVNLTGKHYDVAARPDQRKMLYFRPLGDISALRIEPNPTLNIVASGGGRMWFWISDDARKLPLMLVTQMKYGTIKLVLAGIEPAALPKQILAKH